MQFNHREMSFLCLATAMGFASMFVHSQDIGTPDPDLLTRIYPGFVPRRRAIWKYSWP
jgi:hypothetical protein